MSIAPVTDSEPFRPGDYSLVGEDSTRAVERGLAEADWYQTPVPRDVMRELLERRDGPALRDTAIWFGLLVAFGTAGYLLWPSPWCIAPFAAYWVIYGSSSDARWHEFGHGTAFKTDWLNDAFYEIASFMVMRESIVWRWSHTRHHSDTIVVGRDPEIAVPRPPNVARMLAGFVGIRAAVRYFRRLFLHATGRLGPEEATEHIEVVSASSDEATILSIERGAPLISITRTTRDAEGVAFEYSHDLFRADRTRITVKVKGSPSSEKARLRGRVVELVP